MYFYFYFEHFISFSKPLSHYQKAELYYETLLSYRGTGFIGSF